MSRPTWDEYFMSIARTTATRATCPRRAVGAVLVKELRIIGTGYNGAPRGAAHCPSTASEGDESCMKGGHCVRALHAELNAVIACAHAGVSTKGATAYVTTCPCANCMRVLINAGVERVVYGEVYADPSHRTAAMAETLAVAAGLIDVHQHRQASE